MGDVSYISDASLRLQTERMDPGDTINTGTTASVATTDTIDGFTETQGTNKTAETKSLDDVVQDGVQDEANQNEHGNRYLTTMRPTADTLFTDLSLYTGNASDSHTYSQVPLHESLSPIPVSQNQSSTEASQPKSKWKQSIVWRAWLQSKGMLMVILSQFFGATMNVMTQVLERDGAHGKAMHPFQVSEE